MKTVDWRKALAFVAALASGAGAQAVWNGLWDDTLWYTGAGGKSQAQFTITTAEQLAGLSYLVRGSGAKAGNNMNGKTFTLGGDIALNAFSAPTEWQGWKDDPPENKWMAIGDSAHPFQGTFDGAGFVVRGVYINDSTDYQGLFGYVNGGGTIKKLRVAESYIKGRGYVGGLVGRDSGAITDCYATGEVAGDGDYVGGLAGWSKGTIKNSHATGDVSGFNYVGGLVGARVKDSTVRAKDTLIGSYATGAVKGEGNYVGGLVGFDTGYALIINSYATGDVSGVNYVGGLVGAAAAAVANCYATGSVSGVDTVGGLVGGKYAAEIKNSYAAGAVSGGGYVGGLAGWPDRSTPNRAAVIYGYYDGDASGAGGLGIPKTTEEMQSGKFLELLNVAAYAFSANKWIFPPSPDKYPALSGGAVTESDFLSYFADGSGKWESDPLIIKTVRQLENISVLVNCGADLSGKYFMLGGDVFLNDDTASWRDWGPGGGPDNEWTAIGRWGTPFKGSLDGGGFVIGGVYINDTTVTGRYQGLFGRVGSGGVIKNLGVVGSYVNGYGYVGGLAGHSAGTITNCFFREGSVKATGGGDGAGGVGGLVGVDSAGAITESYADADVSGVVNMVGGLVGWNCAGGKVTYCYAAGNVAVTGDDVGGLVGRNDGGAISDSYALGDVSGRGEDVSGIGGGAVGGLVGINVGINADAVVARCYSVGAVSGKSSFGGLVGFKLGVGRIDSSYYRIDAAPVRNDYGIPQTDDEMKRRDTYVDWDFGGVWAIESGARSYPYLAALGNPIPIAVLSFDRVIPKFDSNKESAAVSPPPNITADFTAGPNPVSKSSGVVNFFRRGKRIAGGELWVYDAYGNALNKIKIEDRDSARSKRKVGSWSLTDAKGGRVYGGTYLVKGVVVGVDGKREKISVPVGVKSN